VIKFVEQVAAARGERFAQAEQLARTMLAQPPPTAGPSEDRAALSMMWPNEDRLLSRVPAGQSHSILCARKIRTF
jgi:hypothetical protein